MNVKALNRNLTFNHLSIDDLRMKLFTILKLKTIYYILPFWIVMILCLKSYISPADLGHFIKSGEIMLEKRDILTHDVFTHTYYGLHYINSGWLSQIFMAILEKAGGLKLLILMKTSLLLLTIAIVYHLILKITRHYKIAFIFTVFAIALGFTNWNIRPQIFIIPIFAYFYSYLYQKKAINISSILLFSLLMILWVNLHSSFPLGFILVVIFLLGEAIEGYYSKENIKDVIRNPYLRRLLFLLIILAFVTLINPYGIDIWKDMWNNALISQRRSVEWQPTMMNDFTGYCFIISIVISSIILKYSKRRIAPQEAILLLAFLLLAFKACRMIIWWGIISAPILAYHFCSIETVQERISRSKRTRSESGCLPLNILILIFLLISTISFLPWLRPYHPIKKFRNFINPETNPIGIVNFIKKQNLKGNMYNDVNWGSYLIWRLWPKYKVFVDNRLHLVPEEIWRDYCDVHYGYANWEKILNKYKISFVLLSKKDNKRIIEFMKESPYWKVAYQDTVGVVFIRSSLTNQKENL